MQHALMPQAPLASCQMEREKFLRIWRGMVASLGTTLVSCPVYHS
jgi:hypothetical protein